MTSKPNLPSIRSVDFLQERFGDKQAEITDREKVLSTEVGRRKHLAFASKFIIVISGVVVASGLSVHLSRFLGILIIVLTAVELQVFRNLERLLVLTEARNAYRRLDRAITSRHTKGLSPLVDKLNSGDAEAVGQYTQLLSDVYDMASSGEDEIETGIENHDLKSLKHLHLEDGDSRL